MPTSELDIIVALFKSAPWVAVVIVAIRYAPGWISSIGQWIDGWGQRMLTDRREAEERFLKELAANEMRYMGYSERIITMTVANQTEHITTIVTGQTEQMRMVMDHLRALERRLDYTMGMNNRIVEKEKSSDA